MKIVKVELYMFASQSSPTEHVNNFIEAAAFCADNSTEKVVFTLDDGTKITFHDTDASNGSNEVMISQGEEGKTNNVFYIDGAPVEEDDE